MKAICPGSFDPITLGHVEIIRRAASIADEVVVAVGQNSRKHYLFEPEQRLALVRDAVADIPGVSAEPIEGLLVDFARSRGAALIVKGLRFASDFEYELQMAHVNFAISGIETVLLPAGRVFGTISSTLLREVALGGGDVGEFVTPAVARAIEELLRAPEPAPQG